MVKVYRAPSGSGKYIGFGLLTIETGAERTTIIILDMLLLNGAPRTWWAEKYMFQT